MSNKKSAYSADLIFLYFLILFQIPNPNKNGNGIKAPTILLVIDVPIIRDKITDKNKVAKRLKVKNNFGFFLLKAK